MRLTVIVAGLAAAAFSALPAFAACSERSKEDCPAAKGSGPKKFVPYDPRDARAGSRPGFIDVGGGTEVRIGGRVRTEYQYNSR